MGLIEAIVLGIVQGLTEFLPISSTAHIRLVPELLGWADPGAAFTASIQLGTLAAIVLFFRRELSQTLAGWLQSLAPNGPKGTAEARLGWAVVLGTVPIVICGLAFKDTIETSLRSLSIIAWGLLAVGILMGAAEMVGRRERREESVQWLDGLLVGLFQALALIPGVSRSGSTMSCALLLGFQRSDAARFSFLLSVPSIFAAGIFSLWSHREVLLGPDQAALWVANAASFVTGYLSIAMLLAMLKRHGFWFFVGYRLVLGIGLLLAIQFGYLRP